MSIAIAGTPPGMRTSWAPAGPNISLPEITSMVPTRETFNGIEEHAGKSGSIGPDLDEAGLGRLPHAHTKSRKLPQTGWKLGDFLLGHRLEGVDL